MTSGCQVEYSLTQASHKKCLSKRREFSNKYICLGLSVLCGTGANNPSSAYDDWCGARRRNQNTGDVFALVRCWFW